MTIGVFCKAGGRARQVATSGSAVLFRLSEDDLAALSPEVRAGVTAVALDRLFNGQILQVSPVLNLAHRQGVARIPLNYAPGLRPGGFAAVRIASGTLVAPRLPEYAILNDEKGRFVYGIHKEGRVERRLVRTGLVTADGIAITQGLSGTEQVVLHSAGFRNAGDKVKTCRAGTAG